MTNCETFVTVYQAMEDVRDENGYLLFTKLSPVQVRVCIPNPETVFSYENGEMALAE